MQFVVLTIFPGMFAPFWAHGIIRRAVEARKIFPSTVNIREYAPGPHHVTDDRPYGGGCGMVMKPEPLTAAIEAARRAAPGAKTVLMSPQGHVLNQTMARELARLDGLIFVCGRYEGVDERVYHDHIDAELSIGDFILSGGEVAAMVVMDTVSRLIPGVLGGESSAEMDSFEDGFLEHAHFTRPDEFNGMRVPEVLLSGHHGRIDIWRRENAMIRTFLKRPELLTERPLADDEVAVLKKWGREIERIIETQPVGGEPLDRSGPPSGRQ
jgi:tRNA (guanine37-N1)-methyltransferase